MNNILFSISSDIIEQFNGAVTVDMILFSLIAAFLISLFIMLVYKLTFSGIAYNKNMIYTFSLLAMITAMIIRTINSNLSLSLGMVGALSIVRFRTAIKDPIDTSFMFWSITAGIMCGAGLYIIAIIGSLLLGILFYVIYVTQGKPKSKYLLVINYQTGCEKIISQVMEKIGKYNLKSESRLSDGSVEVTYEVNFKDNPEKYVKALQTVQGIRKVNLVTYQSNFGF